MKRFNIHCIQEKGEEHQVELMTSTIMFSALKKKVMITIAIIMMIAMGTAGYLMQGIVSGIILNIILTPSIMAVFDIITNTKDKDRYQVESLGTVYEIQQALKRCRLKTTPENIHSIYYRLKKEAIERED